MKIAARPTLLASVLLLSACGKDAVKPSRDAEPPDHLTGPEQACGECHPRHVDEWRSSAHAYAMHDPVFTAMVAVGQKETEGELGDFCVKCHSPFGFRSGETSVRRDGDSGAYVQPTQGLSQAAMDGVSCFVCHSVTKVNTAANADFELAMDGVRRGPIMDPAPSPAHRSEPSALFERTEICGACHDVINPNRVALEKTHIEWVQSIFAGSQSCQACHMPTYRGAAAVGGKQRTLHEHRFVGVDVSLLPEAEFPGYDDQRERTRTLLEQSATLAVTPQPDARRLLLEIKNLAGHALPSGATADREMWVELVVRDAGGTVVFESGTLDGRGDLRVDDPERTLAPGTDPALVLYAQVMTVGGAAADAGAVAPTAPRPKPNAQAVDFLWQPDDESSHLIPPGSTDRPSFDLSALPPGTYTADVRLLFRSFPPHLLRRLEQLAGLDPALKDRVPTVEMATASVTFTF